MLPFFSITEVTMDWRDQQFDVELFLLQGLAADDVGPGFHFCRPDLGGQL